MNICILGYYNRGNLGDESFAVAFSTLLNGHNVKHLNSDDILEIPANTDLVICGGGDIINDYFMTKIGRILQDFRGPVYAISVGVYSHEYVCSGYLERFDHVILRSSIDLERVQQRIGEHNVDFLPDITSVLFLNPSSAGPKSETTVSFPPFRQVSDAAILGNPAMCGIFLARDVCKQGDEHYEQVITSIAGALEKIYSALNSSVVFVFYCFNSNSSQADERDEIINRDIVNRCKLPPGSMLRRFEEYNFFEMQTEIQKLDVAICMRFHSHVFCTLNDVPFVSLNTSRKVNTFCMDFCLEEFMIMKSNADARERRLFPSSEDISNKFLQMVNNYLNSLKVVSQAREVIKERALGYYQFFHMLNFNKRPHLEELTSKIESSSQVHHRHKALRLKKRLLPPFFFSPEEEKMTRTCALLLRVILCIDQPPEQLVSLCVQGRISLLDVCRKVGIENKCMEVLSACLSQIISFCITGKRYSRYNYGLEQKVLSQEYDFPQSWAWIVKNYTSSQTFSNNHLSYDGEAQRFEAWLLTDPKYMLNLRILDQMDQGGVHRSGWQYIVDHFNVFHSENKSAPVLDFYLDKTFGWYSSFYSVCGVIPFVKPWYGFLHHTFSTYHSENNAQQVLDNPRFLESLPFCKGIFVLSSCLKDNVISHLKKKGLNTLPPLFVIRHPTEFPSEKFLFSIEKFKQNPQKKLVQVGAWLRNPYAIYALPLEPIPSNEQFSIKKAILKGRCMEEYFLKEGECFSFNICNKPLSTEGKENQIDLLIDFAKSFPLDSLAKPISHNNTSNKHILGLVQHVRDNFLSVQQIDFVSNNEYDDLLSRNIVFLNLIDASAVNTIIECIVRSTPVLVNRLPAVEEYLGKDYPFYYSNFREAVEKATDVNVIQEAHSYLSVLDKADFCIQNFVTRFAQFL